MELETVCPTQAGRNMRKRNMQRLRGKETAEEPKRKREWKRVAENSNCIKCKLIIIEPTKWIRVQSSCHNGVIEIPTDTYTEWWSENCSSCQKLLLVIWPHRVLLFFFLVPLLYMCPAYNFNAALVSITPELNWIRRHVYDRSILSACFCERCVRCQGKNYIYFIIFVLMLASNVDPSHKCYGQNETELTKRKREIFWLQFEMSTRFRTQPPCRKQKKKKKHHCEREREHITLIHSCTQKTQATSQSISQRDGVR